MNKQLRINLTFTETELEQIKKVADKLGNKPATIAKQILMEKIRENS